jgi:hypothetical protein
MINQVFSILLATSIVACPLFCKGGRSCCGTDYTDVAQSCCDRCHQVEAANSANQNSVPADRNSRAPENCGGCICGGAVVEGVSLPLQMEFSDWIVVSVTEQFIAAVSKTQQEAVSWMPFSDDGMNPGRAMRNRMMSLLC